MSTGIKNNTSLRIFKWKRESKIFYIVGKQLPIDEHIKYLDYIKTELQNNDLVLNNIKVIRMSDYIYEKDLKVLGKQDLVLWHPFIASKNVDLVTHFNSTVILQKQTVFIQKASKYNPFTENMAVNLGININYIDKEDDITNLEYKLVVPNTYYEVNNLGEYCKNFLNENS